MYYLGFGGDKTTNALTNDPKIALVSHKYSIDQIFARLFGTDFTTQKKWYKSGLTLFSFHNLFNHRLSSTPLSVIDLVHLIKKCGEYYFRFAV